MKNKNIKKTIAVWFLVPIIAFSTLYANADNKKEVELTDENIWLDVNFVNSKPIILNYLKQELKYATNEKIKNQIKKSLETLEKITDENKFYKSVNKEYAKIDSISSQEERKDYNFEEEKNDIFSDLEIELKKLVKDNSVKTKVIKNISELKKIQDEDTFFDKLSEIYEFLDNYYEKNNITFVSEEDLWDYSFEKEKKEVLTELKEKTSKLKDKELKQKIENLAKINYENNFFTLLDEIQQSEAFWQYYFEMDKNWILEDENSQISKEQKEILEKIKNEEEFYEKLHKFEENL